MKELELVVPAKDLVPVTKVLAGHGVFHQVDASYLSAEAQGGSANSWQEKATVFGGLERRVQILMQNLSIDEGQPPSTDRDIVVEPAGVVASVDALEAAVKSMTDALSAEEKHLEQLETIIRQLEPVASVDLDISALRNPRYMFSLLGVMPPANIERMQTSLARVPHVFLNLHQDSTRAVVWLGGLAMNADILERAARSAYLSALSLPDTYSGNPAKIIADVRKDITSGLASIAEKKRELAKLGQVHKKELVSTLWDVRSSRLLTDAIVRFGKLHFTYVVVGWVPAVNIDELSARIKSVSKETIIESFSTTREGSAVPVSLYSSKFLQPFQSLVTTYARPLYGEIDPTILIAISFPLLYGAMFGDVGHGGLLALLGAAIMSGKVKALNSFKSLGGLILACGLMAVLFGFGYASIFGNEEFLTEFYTPIIQPYHSIMPTLEAAIAAGIVILNLGFFVGIYNAVALRDWGRVFFDPKGVTGLMLYWAMILSLIGAYKGITIVPAPILIVLGVIGAIGVTFAEIFKHLIIGHRPLIEGGIGMYAVTVFFELFEAVIGFLSNTLSYVRVGAFAVAHGGLSAVVFLLAGENMASVQYWLVVIIGTLFITGFEGLIVGIQTMRLEYYEFFSKFFTGGGLRFEPLRLQSADDK
jgi:V/A-type H+-transporting ATPase subunit I